MGLTVQYAIQANKLPAEFDFAAWVAAALLSANQSGDVLLRIVDTAESRQLNNTYRNKDAATNVLSFPVDIPPEIALHDPLHDLGDLVICAPVVEHEAAEQGKILSAHWAHMVIHGVLHLCGYDHQTGAEADKMEAMERKILSQFNFPDPYNPL